MTSATTVKPSRSAAVVFGAVIVVAAVIVAAVGLGTEGATALEVGSARLSRQSLNDELHAFAENGGLVKAAGPGSVTTAPGSVVSQAGAYLSTWWIRQQLALRVLDDKGARVNGDDRSTALDSLQSTFGPSFAGFPVAFRQRMTDRLASVAAVARVAPSSYLRLLRREAADAGVTVDPVYGLYRPRRIEVGPFPTPASPATSSSQG